MIIGEVAKWLDRLPPGKAVLLTREAMHDSAKAYVSYMLFDHVRPEDLQKVADEVNSEEYPGFSLWERPDGRWTLERTG